MGKNKSLHPRPGVEYFPDTKVLLLIRCPECGKENYALNVASGACIWCGYNTHSDKTITNYINQFTNGKI